MIPQHTTGQGSRGHLQQKACPVCKSTDIDFDFGRKQKMCKCCKYGKIMSRKALGTADVYLPIG
jgi:hypothetical protein